MGAARLRRISASLVSRPIPPRLVHKSVHKSGCWPGTSPYAWPLPCQGCFRVSAKCCNPGRRVCGPVREWPWRSLADRLIGHERLMVRLRA